MLDDFDKQFKKTQSTIFLMTIISAVVSVGLLGFGIWVVVKVMAHFGVI